jgi:hypothetical protein
MMAIPKTSEEALAWIRKAATEGEIPFASDVVCAALQAEIQQIYATIRLIETGQPPRRDLWTADGQTIAGVMPRDADRKPTQEACEAVRRAGEQLGIPLLIDDKWEDAALRLRNKQKGTGGSS